MSCAKESSSDDSQYECPVCLEILVPPILQCCNGHLICAVCVEQLTNCPICRDDLPAKKIRALAIENIIRESTNPCPFNKNGCKILLPDNDSAFEDHQFRCSYAIWNYCAMIGLDCNEKVTRSDLNGHLTAKHNIPYVHYACGDELGINDHIFLQRGGNNEDMERPCLVLIQTRNETFVVKFNHDQKEEIVSWKVMFLGAEKSARRFDTSIRVVSAEPSAVEDAVSLEWKGPISYLKSNSASPSQILGLFLIPYKHYPGLFSVGERDGKLKWKIMLMINTASNEKSNIVKVNDRGSCDQALTSSDSIAHASVVHSAYCDGCNESGIHSQDRNNITGARYRCIICPDYDLCERCMRKKTHAHHLFVVIPHPIMLSQFLHLRNSGTESRTEHSPFSDMSVVHFGSYCDGCNNGNGTCITGPRYKCMQCSDYDLCHNCMRNEIHAHHLFIIIRNPHMRDQLSLLH